MLAVWDNQTNATVGAGGVVQVFVTFDSTVTVNTAGGAPTLTLTLDNGQTAVVNYAAGSGTTSLEFDYTVGASDTNLKLDYVSTTALALNGGTILDCAGRECQPDPAGPGWIRLAPEQ